MRRSTVTKTMKKNIPKTTRVGHAAAEAMMSALSLGFRLRAIGGKSGHVSASGGGVWGLMRSLSREGPQTVPALARARPVSRQHIQTLANEMAADGLIEFVDNPRHKRSKLARLTPKGKAEFAALDARFKAFAETVAEGLDAEALENAVSVLEDLRDRIAAQGDQF
jgi:DNA-binding MarR family transcriptional regulator